MSVCLSGCLSVDDASLYASHLLLFRLFPIVCECCPPTASDNPSCLSDASRSLCEHHLSLSHEWLYLHGHWAFFETRKSTLYKSLLLFMVSMSRIVSLANTDLAVQVVASMFAKQGALTDIDIISAFNLITSKIYILDAPLQESDAHTHTKWQAQKDHNKTNG